MDCGKFDEFPNLLYYFVCFITLGPMVGVTVEVIALVQQFNTHTHIHTFDKVDAKGANQFVTDRNRS